ncbi:MAG: ribosome biogenesis GTPase Der [Patescibacteria group bacterium]|nr:ribosome biogenesis GTPase Der [Patescibacteria group bacterium]MDD5490235.1 ribosome biogenesis GTPase Der [Patescibacteria group bacterium]
MLTKSSKNQLPKVVIIGKMNVGKSTLFNRLAEKHLSLTSPVPGTTRDRHFADTFWNGYGFKIIDTGGIMAIRKTGFKAGEEIEEAIQKQTQIALDEAEVIIFMVDGREGILSPDKELARAIKQTRKPTILVINKIDNPKLRAEYLSLEWPKLNLGEPTAISAANGSGVGDLLDKLTDTFKKLKIKKTTLEKVESIKISFIGKPNVGKSSLLNALLGEERVITSPIAHTTREPENILMEYKNKNFLLVDTAGIRKKARVESGLERMGVAKSIQSLGESDIAFFVTDASEALTVQDSQLAETIVNYGVGIIIIANKWDLIEEKDSATINKFVDYYYSRLPQLSWAPIIFISAKTGKSARKTLDLALEVCAERNKEITQSQLDKFLKKIIKIHPPTRGSGATGGGFGKPTRHPYIYEINQIDTNPPKFQIIISKKVVLDENYVRFIEKQMRKTFGFTGTPIHLVIKHR